MSLQIRTYTHHLHRVQKGFFRNMSLRTENRIRILFYYLITFVTKIKNILQNHYGYICSEKYDYKLIKFYKIRLGNSHLLMFSVTITIMFRLVNTAY